MPGKAQPSNINTEELRLFPLGLVLLPGMSLPLRIFEERYKLMIGECLDKDVPFGVVLIKEGYEVGGLATYHTVGTTARITKTERLENGRYALQTVGEQPFSIHQITQEKPFLMGTVEYLDDGVPGRLGDLPSKAQELLSQYWKLLVRIKGGWVRNVDMPSEPRALSYAVAQAVGSPPMVAQYLLQISSIKERLERGIRLLQERLDRIKEELDKLPPYQGPRLN